MTWSSVPADEVCDILDFWVRAPWPMTRDEANAHAAELGWVVTDGDFLENPRSGVSSTDVLTAAAPDGELRTMTFWTTDIIKEVSSGSTEFLGDAFAVTVRQGTSRWGEPRLRELDTADLATWDVPTGARVEMSRGRKAVTATFSTPAYAAVLRRQGE